MKLGERIRQNRVDKGLTQQDLAERLNVSRPTISNWETGRTYPDLESLVEISNLFGESLDRLLKGDGETVRRMNLDMLKGRKLKRILAFVLTPVLIYTVFVSWRVYADKQKEVVPLEDIYNVTMTAEGSLSTETEVRGEVNLEKNETVGFATIMTLEDTAYVYVFKRPGIIKTNEFSVPFTYIEGANALNKVVLLSGDEFNSELGNVMSDFKNAPSQKVIWERDAEQ